MKRGLTMSEQPATGRAWRPRCERAFPAVRDPAMPERQGLYDPSFEKDSCGVGFIADMKNRKTHAIVAAGPADPAQSRPSRRGRRRSASRRRRRHPDPDPARFFARGMRAGSASRCRSPAITPSASSSCRRTTPCRAHLRGASSRRRSTEEGPDLPRLARRAGRQFLDLGETVQADRAGAHRQLFIGRAGRRSPTRTISSARLYRPAQVGLQHGLQAAGPRRPRPTTRSRCRAAPSSTRACSWPTSSAPIIHDLTDPRLRERARAGASALLDQHLPVLDAGASLPDGRPQRRDQHAARQRQLDGGAPGLASIPSCSATTSRKLWPISYEGQSDTACFDNALEFLVQGGYSLAHADDDADPGGLGRQPADG